MNEPRDQISITFELALCWALLSASGCGCSHPNETVAHPVADTVHEHGRSGSLTGGPRPASPNAVTPVPEPQTASIPPLVKPNEGDTPINSGAGNATPLQGPERARLPIDTPQ